MEPLLSYHKFDWVTQRVNCSIVLLSPPALLCCKFCSGPGRRFMNNCHWSGGSCGRWGLSKVSRLFCSADSLHSKFRGHSHSITTPHSIFTAKTGWVADLRPADGARSSPELGALLYPGLHLTLSKLHKMWTKIGHFLDTQNHSFFTTF